MQQNYAAEYGRLYHHHWWWRARQRAILRELERLPLRPGEEHILDVGCGDGLFFEPLSRYGTVEGVEVDESLLTPDSPFRERIYLGPFDERFRPKRPYTLILMLDVLEHLADENAALSHAFSLLAPGGTLLITVPAYRLLWTTHDDLNHHVTRYSRTTLRRAVEGAGGRVVSMRSLFQWTCPVKLAQRVKESFVTTRPAPPQVPPPWLNGALYGVSVFEQSLFDRVPAPFGSSLLCVCRAGVAGSALAAQKPPVAPERRP